MEVVRGVIEHRLRSTLATGAVAVGMLALTLTGAMAEHFHAQFQGGDAYYSRNVQVADDASGPAGVISLTKVDAIQRVPGVAVALPWISVLARPGSVGVVPLALPDTAGYTDPRERGYSGLRTALAAGRALDPNRQGEVVLGAGLAGEFGIRVGDRLDLPVRPPNPNPDFVNHPFRVVGILKRTNTLPDDVASVGLQDAQLLLQESLPASFRDRVDPSSLASGITVYGKPGVNLDRLADQINARVGGVQATRPSDFVRGFDQGAQFTAIAAGAGLLGLLFGAMAVGVAMLLAVVERSREIGLKMTVGARAWHIAVEHLLEATALGLAGGVAGFTLGAGLAWLLDLAGRSVSMDVFLVTGGLARVALGLAVAVGAGAGALPALRAAQLDPDLALRA